MDHSGSEGFSGKAPEDGALFDGVPFEERNPKPLFTVTELELPGLIAALEIYNMLLRELEISEATGVQDLRAIRDATDEELEIAITNNKLFGIKAEARIETLVNLRNSLEDLIKQAEGDI